MFCKLGKTMFGQSRRVSDGRAKAHGNQPWKLKQVFDFTVTKFDVNPHTPYAPTAIELEATAVGQRPNAFTVSGVRIEVGRLVMTLCWLVEQYSTAVTAAMCGRREWTHHL